MTTTKDSPKGPITCPDCGHKVLFDGVDTYGHGYRLTHHDRADGGPVRTVIPAGSPSPRPCPSVSKRFSADGTYLGRFKMGCWERGK
jgi:DNA-directed RNA polymerase subunit RPC12/RpoP